MLLRMYNGGGEKLTLGSGAANSFNIGSASDGNAVTIGGGVTHGGGDVTCNSASVGVNGSGNGIVFCIGSGFGNVVLSAPSSGSFQHLVIVGPLLSAGGALFTDGASNTTLAGAIYFPMGPFNLAGSATVGHQVGQCLAIVATQVVMSGGTKAITASCFPGSSGTSTAMLVQ